MKYLLKLIVLALLLSVLPLGAQAEKAPAKEISSINLVTSREHMAYPQWLFNGDIFTWQSGEPHMAMTLEHPEGIGSIYLLFDVWSGEYTLINEDTGEEAVCGKEGFLHDYTDVAALFGEAPKSLTIRFGYKGPKISELRVFTEGEPPADVQQWKNAPEEGVDLLLFPTHGDDEQLFFAGLLPYYAGEKGYEVQVVYSTDHHNYGTVRPHEMLNGLWAVGVRNYPVFGPFPDFLTQNEQGALESIKPQGYDREDVFSFVMEQLRRFKPLVAVGHDLGGEYGHGFHRLYGRMVMEASEKSMDPEVCPESAEKYGVWDVPKTYIHLYPENSIHMNWDIPLEAFQGMTAYEVTKKLGYPAHHSQYTGFAWYFADHDTAESIDENGPCDYGLCRSTVGPDAEKNDFFENLVDRKEQKRLDEEKRLQEEEEQRRLREDQAQREEEEQARAASEAAAREADRQAQEEISLYAELQGQRTRELLAGFLGGLVALVILMVIILLKILK